MPLQRDGEITKFQLWTRLLMDGKKKEIHNICNSLSTFFFVFLCSHLSTVLGNKFDHGAEAIVPTLFNLVPNSAKVMATSGCAAIRFIIRVGSFLFFCLSSSSLPLSLFQCTSKSHCFFF